MRFVRKPLEIEAVNIGELKQSTVQLEWVKKLLTDGVLQFTENGVIFKSPAGVETQNDNGFLVRDSNLQIAIHSREAFYHTYQASPLTPRAIETIETGAKYLVPIFEIKDGHIEQSKDIISFAKGDIRNPEIFRQRGFFVDTLLEVCKQYLTDVNVGDLAAHETVVAITHIDEAMMWINKRRQDREARGVLSTYKK